MLNPEFSDSQLCVFICQKWLAFATFLDF